MNCDERRDSILLYTSGCFDPAERAAVCEHLATGCPVCTATLVEAQAVIGMLAGAVDPVTPPAAAFDKLMKRIGDSSGSAEVPRGPRLAITDAEPDRSGRRTTAKPSRRRLFIAVATTAAACIAVTAAALLHWTRDARTFWQSGDLVTVQLGSGLQPNARGQLWWDRAHNRGRIVIDNATRPAAGREFEVWIIPPGSAPVRSESFNVNAAGDGEVIIPIPAGTAAGSTFAITDEPLGGLDAPTGQIHFAGTLGSQ